MLNFSVENYVGSSKLTKWTEYLSKVLTDVSVNVADASSFDGEILEQNIGNMKLVKISTQAGEITRSGEQASWSRDRNYVVLLQDEGTSHVFQNGREVIIQPGDMTLVDSGMAFSINCTTQSQLLCMMVNHNHMKRKIPSPEAVLARAFSKDMPLVGMLSDYMSETFSLAQSAELSDDITKRIGEHISDMFVIACMNQFGTDVLASATGAARRSQIRCYIESNLKNPDLSVSTIANAFKISRRYLHMLFADGQETVSELIRRRRLEEIKKRLGNQAWRKRTITRLAFEWGFNNTTHFARVFRDKYGVSPREYRNSVIAQEKVSAEFDPDSNSETDGTLEQISVTV